MGTYLQGYGIEEARRGRIVKRIVIAAVSVLLIAGVLYLIFQDYSEKQTVKKFISKINAHDYQNAYTDWGCSVANPCRNYNYARFMEDWGPGKKTGSGWKIASVDGCRNFVTVNVQADGVELQSLEVDRGSHTVGYAPSPECQERKWRWKQFFQRIFGGSA